MGEANKLRWAHFKFASDKNGGQFLGIQVPAATKTGARSSIPMREAAEYLSRWKRLSEQTGPQDLVWSGQRRKNDPAERPLKDANKTFQAFLKRVPYLGRATGLLDDADGKRRTLYSLRHTYATTAMLSGLLTDMDLARNMGTGLSQIEKHYSHVKNHHRAAALTGISLPGYQPDPSSDSLFKIGFAGPRRGRATVSGRGSIDRTPSINFERAEALFKLAEARRELLPFIDAP